ncbi:MAG: prepilin-type N-terminal cleavage/methylation domain-containing protein [Candidatus Omnitrophica bacterium]|nr:prepilin-type N-terminal cleavage/methylation domain-containing protein [Candidatus Omnitrophota bacterium]
MKRKNSFTLLEIIISIIIVGIGLSTIAVVFMGGRFMLKQAENKSRATSVAAQKLEEYLTKSFTGLGGLTQLTQTYGDVDTGTGGADIPVDWRVNVTTKWEINASLGIRIPYKYIEVTASYNEQSPSGAVQRRVVKLANIVPYPYMHTQIIKIEPTSGSAPRVNAGAYQSINGLSLNFNYPVNKDVMVIYNISIHIDNDTGITPIDTIYTGCFLDGHVIPEGTETRTPISMQPYISNVLALSGVGSDTNHTIQIKWKKDTIHGNIRLKEANLMIVSTERQ